MRINKKIKVILATFFLSFSIGNISGQQIGYPYIINFFNPSNKYLSADVNDFAFLPNGMIVAATSEGVMFYDGNNWSNINVKGNFLSVAYDKSSNKIYLGTHSSFGYLEFDETFSMYLYKRLSILVPDKIKNVWYIIPTKYGVYFFVNKHSLYLYDYTGILKIQTSPDFHPNRGFYIKKQLFVVDDSAGIGKVVGKKFIKLTDNKDYNHESIRIFLPTSHPQEFLFITKEGGIYRLNILSGEIKPVMKNITKLLRNTEVYSGCYLNDSLIAIGTLNNGLYLATCSDKIIDHLNVNYGLSSDQINRVKVGKNNKVIYLATSRFFNFVLYFYPFRFFDESAGFQGNIADYEFWNHKLYLSTNKGLYVKNLSTQDNFSLLSKEALFYRSSMEKMKFPDGREALVVGSLRKLFLITEDGKLHSLGKIYNLYSIKQSRLNPYEFYALSFDTLYVFRLNKNLTNIHTLVNIPLPVIYETIELDNNDNIIGITQTSKRLDKLIINRNNRSLKIETLNSTSINKSIHTIRDSIFLILTNNGLYKLDNQKQSLVPYSLKLNDNLCKNATDVLDFYADTLGITFLGKKFLYTYRYDQDSLSKIPQVGKSWKPPANIQLYKHFLVYNKSFELVFADYKILLSGKLRQAQEKPILSSIKIGDFVFYALTTQPQFEVKNNKYTLNVSIPYAVPITFKFSLINTLPHNATYSYYLKGYSQSWSKWTNDNSITFNSLFPRRYKLLIKVKSNTTGKIYELKILFKVKPPFFLSYYALGIYIIILLLVIYSAIKISTRRQEIIRRRLEKLVKKRTHELEVKNKVLKRNNTMLKNLTEELKTNKEELIAQNERLRLTNLELRQLSLVAQYTNNAVLILDDKGRIEWWNKGFASLFEHKFKKVQDAIIPKAIRIIRPDVFERLLNFDPNFKSITYTTHEVIPETGEDLWYQTTITAVRDENGKIYRFVILDMDITELKIAEKKIKLQRDKLEAQTQVLTKTNQELLESRKRLEYQHQEMLSSMEYAKRLQKALLPKESFLKLFPNGFIFYLPKEIVSGDFYSFEKRKNRVIFAVGDATGHGVPGAFMSVLGLTLLKDAIERNEDNLLPNKILETLRTAVIKALHHNILSRDIKDGMDIGLGVIDLQTRKLFFAGANISINIIRDKDMLIEIRANRMPIGIKELQKLPFNLEIFQLQDHDRIYMYSDGFIDQFGGPYNKRYKRTKFKNLLLSLQNYPMKEQEAKLQDELDSWMLDNEQVDDILVIGFDIDFVHLKNMQIDDLDKSTF